MFTLLAKALMSSLSRTLMLIDFVSTLSMIDSKASELFLKRSRTSLFKFAVLVDRFDCKSTIRLCRLDAFDFIFSFVRNSTFSIFAASSVSLALE